MSLIISKDIKNPNKPNADGFYTGYKIVGADNNAYCMPNQTFNTGVNISNREEQLKKLSKKELKGNVWEKVAGTNTYKYEVLTNMVDLGFHICLTKEDVLNIFKYMKENETEQFNSVKIIEVLYKEADIVSYGTWMLNNTVRCLVVDKMTIQSLEGV